MKKVRYWVYDSFLDKFTELESTTMDKAINELGKFLKLRDGELTIRYSHVAEYDVTRSYVYSVNDFENIKFVREVRKYEEME